jgi:hypothetical protein
MGSIIDKLREDEEEYFWICKELGVKTNHDKNMYSHIKQICDQFGVEFKWELKEIIGKIKLRQVKIDQILKK